MKSFQLFLAVVFAGLASGCGQSSTSNNPSTTQTPATPPVASPAPAPASSTSLIEPPPVTTPPAAASSDTSAAPQLAVVREDMRQTSQDIANYTYAEKGVFVQKIRAGRDELNQELAQLTAKVDAASDAVKAEAQPKLDALHTQIVQLDAELEKVDICTEATWDNMKDEAKKSYDDAKMSVQDAVQWVNSKVNS